MWKMHPALLVLVGALTGVLADRLLDAHGSALAQARGLTLSGSCDSGDVVVSDGGDRVRCVEPDEIDLVRCDDDEVLGTDTWGHLRCVGPSSSSWGVRGLLPSCSSGDTLVSEGFGSWRCQSPSR